MQLLIELAVRSHSTSRFKSKSKSNKQQEQKQISNERNPIRVYSERVIPDIRERLVLENNYIH